MKRRSKLRFLAMAGSAALLTDPVTPAAQLPAPTALSEFSRCAHHTCTWVPSSRTTHIFRRGALTYTVQERPHDAGGDFVLRRGDRELLRTELAELSASVTVVWSDDDESFAVTWSDGGAVGGFHVRVFHVVGDVVTEWPAPHQAVAAFRTEHGCTSRGNNAQAYGWVPNSGRLVLVLSVHPTSDCGADAGRTEGYVVDAATGTIEETWGIGQLRAYLGAHPEL